MLVQVHTMQPTPFIPYHVVLETNVSRGIKFHLSGNVHPSLKENRQRVYTVLKNSNWHWPGQRITLNFRPVEVLKKGGHYDLPMAVGILAASRQIECRLLEKTMLYGGVKLNGDIEECSSAYTLLESAKRFGFKRVVMRLPEGYIRALKNVFQQLDIIHVSTFAEVVEFLQHGKIPMFQENLNFRIESTPMCFSEVRGLDAFKSGLEIAAAGGHHILLNGSPGIGKTMLLERYSTILPDINPAEEVLVAMIRSIKKVQHSKRRPMIRSVNSDTLKSLFGGRHLQVLKSLFEEFQVDNFFQDIHQSCSLKENLSKYHCALGGTLCFDEVVQLPKSVLDGLLHHMDCYKTQFLMAMNPCQCGYHNHPNVACSCTPASFHRYKSLLSGAFKDRVDLILEHSGILERGKQESSEAIKKRVVNAWRVQIERQGTQNSRLSIEELKERVLVSKELTGYFKKVSGLHRWSFRRMRSALSLILTQADLNNEPPGLKHARAIVQLIQPDQIILKSKKRGSPVRTKINWES